MSEVVGFAGRAGSGKMTAALALHRFVRPQNGQHIEFSDPIVSVAEGWLEAAEGTAGKAAFLDSLGDVLITAYDVDPSSLIAAGLTSPVLEEYTPEQTRGITHKITPETKGQYRGLLEWLGKCSLELICPTFWADVYELRAKAMLRDGSDLVTISGVRSSLDAQAVRNVGGSNIRLHREQPTKVRALPTEIGVNTWQADFDISNRASKDNLSTSLQSVWRAILAKPT